ncbi:MAG: hypothetical protein JXX28_01550 [Deltaproteobacteria bacterium]|nr:hypothetical protein [Deltaproteobacteria bacterium]
MGKLAGRASAELSHGDVERLVERDGRELLRLLMQDHVDLRAIKEEATIEPTRGADGVQRTELEKIPNRATTMLAFIGGVDVDAYLAWVFDRRGSHKATFGMSAAELTPMAYRDRRLRERVAA